MPTTIGMKRIVMYGRTRDAAPNFAYLTFMLIVVLAVVYQGSLGGRMVFGK